jgi:hypothetical protein
MKRIKSLNIQNHYTLASRYRRMASACLHNQKSNDGSKDETYLQLVGLANEHERKAKVFRKRNPPTFIFVRR